jgi:outer membrane lipoprotein LolB
MRVWRRLALASAGGLAAGRLRDAAPHRSPPGVQVWSGRLALNVEGAQPFSAGFELKGLAASGRADLVHALGGTGGVLVWAPGSASLRSSKETRQFASLDELARKPPAPPCRSPPCSTGWKAAHTEVPGWQVDVSQVGQGRLRAQRATPPPAADLRVVFEH